MEMMGYSPGHFASLPVWEEWIEIAAAGSAGRGRVSLPVWEEWIEIGSARRVIRRAEGLFPYGKSGLKCPPRRR